MGLPSGTRDSRTFQQYAKLDATGTVVAICDCADGAPPLSDGVGSFYVNVTDLYPHDLYGVKVAAAAVSGRDPDAAKADLQKKNKVKKS